MTKSEKLALAKIYELTANCGKINTIITNDAFIQKGLSRRDIVIKATNSLHEQGLIFKVKNDEHCFRYSLSKAGKIEGVHVFNKLKEVKK